MLSDYKNMAQINVSSASGKLFNAERIIDDFPVTIKFNYDPSPSSVDRFQRENDILYDLMPHDYIIEPLTHVSSEPYEGETRSYYVMSKSEMNLVDWLYLNQAKNVQNKLKIFTQICLGLKHAHEKGYIHRDLHPKNVLLNSSPTDIVKLIDFGRAYDFNHVINLSHGNPAWGNFVMPPEIRFGTIDDPNSIEYEKGDLYALGIILMIIMGGNTDIINKIFKINLEMYEYIDPSIPIERFESYYRDSSIEERRAKFNSWLQQYSELVIQDFSIELSDVELGDKLTLAARGMLAFDPGKRIPSIDDIINTIKGL